MANLPKRRPHIDVEIEDTDGGETIRVATVSDEQVADLVGDADIVVRGDTTQATLPPRRLIELFRDQVRGAENVQIEGEDFDASDPEHVDAIPMQWKTQVARELVEYATMDEETGKDSAVPASPSPRETRLSELSPPVSAASSTRSSG